MQMSDTMRHIMSNLMRILNEKTDESISHITLYLTVAEASELRDSLDSLISNPVGHHEHIPSDDYSKEVTICVYSPKNLDGFNERSRHLIMQDI